MRKIDYNQYSNEKKEKYYKLRAIIGGKRTAGRKPRNEDEQNALIKWDYMRYRKWIENGDLVIVNPRKYIVTL